MILREHNSLTLAKNPCLRFDASINPEIDPGEGYLSRLFGSDIRPTCEPVNKIPC